MKLSMIVRIMQLKEAVIYLEFKANQKRRHILN